MKRKLKHAIIGLLLLMALWTALWLVTLDSGGIAICRGLIHRPGIAWTPVYSFSSFYLKDDWHVFPTSHIRHVSIVTVYMAARSVF